MNRPMLKPGDPCPCCGQPIKTADPKLLLLLTAIAEYVPVIPDDSEVEP